MDQEIKNQFDALEKRVQELEKQKNQRVTIIAHSGSMDRILSALVIALGAATLNYPATIFFTFWGLNAIKSKKIYKGKGFKEKLVTFLNPNGLSDLPLSHHNFLGLGKLMMKKVMKERGCSSTEELFELCKQNGVKLIGCEMTCQIMQIQKEELLEGIDYVGVTTFFDEAARSSIVLFI